jgi:hypothetical protein
MSPIMVKKRFITCEFVRKVGMFTRIINTRVNFLMGYMCYNMQSHNKFKVANVLSSSSTNSSQAYGSQSLQ